MEAAGGILYTDYTDKSGWHGYMRAVAVGDELDYTARKWG